MTDVNTDDVTYVQVARRLVSSGSAVALLDLSPATVFLTGSGTAMGYLTTGMFLDRWYAQSSGSSTRAVAAVLSLLDPEQDPWCDAHLQLCLPRIRSAGLEYQVSGVTGDVPPSAGSCVLFISPPKEPLTPRLAGRESAERATSTSSVEALGTSPMGGWRRG